jgi:predicted histone-like DNA-binding protein
MAVKLKKIQRKSPLNPALVKWYLTQESAGSVGLQEIAKEIEGRSALSLGDVQSVLNNLMEVIPIFLKLGQSIKLEGFGTFRVTVSSDGGRTERPPCERRKTDFSTERQSKTEPGGYFF